MCVRSADIAQPGGKKLQRESSEVGGGGYGGRSGMINTVREWPSVRISDPELFLRNPESTNKLV